MAAALVGGLLGLVHASITELPGVNDVAAGIAMIVFGSGLAFFIGKQFVAPLAPQLPVFDLGGWSANPVVRAALCVSPLVVMSSGRIAYETHSSELDRATIGSHFGGH